MQCGPISCYKSRLMNMIIMIYSRSNEMSNCMLHCVDLIEVNSRVTLAATDACITEWHDLFSCLRCTRLHPSLLVIENCVTNFVEQLTKCSEPTNTKSLDCRLSFVIFLPAAEVISSVFCKVVKVGLRVNAGALRSPTSYFQPLVPHLDSNIKR